MKLNLRAYIWYKFFNSLFFGVSVGSIFVLYTPLEPSIYSLGGIILALGLLFMAKWYDVMMNIKVFFQVTLLVEIIVLLFIVFFLIFSYSYMSALCIYIGYQITFMFGSYLVRMETITLKKTFILSVTDVAKQKGYLMGMIVSFLFYKVLEYFNISNKNIQVYDLHIILFVLQCFILFLVIKAFRYDIS